jgi:hypothetical protein
LVGDDFLDAPFVVALLRGIMGGREEFTFLNFSET